MRSTEVDFSTVVHNQLNSLIAANGISTELKMQDHGYQISILVEKIEDGEE